MSEYAAINALRKAERDLTKANAELASENKRLKDELAAVQRDHANARAWILQMQTERKDLLTAAMELVATYDRWGTSPIYNELRAAIAKTTGQEAQNAS